jgi:hypothetical protein
LKKGEGKRTFVFVERGLVDEWLRYDWRVLNGECVGD